MIPNKLFFDRELNTFLNIHNNNIISSILLHGDKDILNTEINYFTRKENDNSHINYLNVNKLEFNEDINNIFFNHSKYFSEQKNRIDIKIGRFLTKVLKKETFERFNILTKDVENFVNLYKSYFDFDEKKLQIIKGNDIKYWYLEENYLNIYFGTLWKSCMRQKERNKFLEMYSKNENCSMLILLDDNGKLRARALLWDKVIDVNTGIEYKVMDRIYTIYDHDVNLFKSWAFNNGYITKVEQNSKSESFFQIDNENVTNIGFKIKLNAFNLNYYPYLDTFKFIDINNGYLYNYDKSIDLYKLTRSDGRLEEIDLEIDLEFENED
jgi:hypothetical protein